jgi:uncharacterized repeat protein (TIGR03803 family)
MEKPRGWRIGFVAFMLFMGTVIAAPAQTFTKLVDFNSVDGSNPSYALVQGLDGNLYGTAGLGGPGDSGTVFKITTNGVLTSLHYFCEVKNCPKGALPSSPLLLLPYGVFWGTTLDGGANSAGTLFKISSTPGSFRSVYSFCAQPKCVDGSAPQAALIRTAGGFLLGTTSGGGTSGFWGTAYKITSAGPLTLHSFCTQTGCPDGSDPGTLIQAADGKFYGVAGNGGKNKGGTIFTMTQDGTVSTLYSFCSQANCADGNGPIDLIQAVDGNLYGATYFGGSGGAGTVFKITPGGTLTTLYSFCSQANCADGSSPNGVIQATDGNLYGTTANGGTTSCHFCGTIFEITPLGALTTLHSFDRTDGQVPEGNLVQDTDGNFYGTAAGGGANNDGTVFRLSVGLGPFVEALPDEGKVGQDIRVLGQGLTGTTAVSFNGTAANFVVQSDTYLTATVPQGATTGFVTATTPGGTLQSNVVFRVKP